MWNNTPCPLRYLWKGLLTILTILGIVPGSSGGRMQQQASACLLDIAQASSGDVGCAVASSEEIDTLLTALQQSSTHVRDAALRVNTFLY